MQISTQMNNTVTFIFTIEVKLITSCVVEQMLSDIIKYFSLHLYSTEHTRIITVNITRTVVKLHEKKNDIRNAGIRAIRTAPMIAKKNGRSITSIIIASMMKNIVSGAMIYSPLLCFVLYIYLLKQYNKTTVFLLVLVKIIKKVYKHKKTDEQHIRNIGL